MVTSLASAARSALLSLSDVNRLTSLRRSMILYSQGQVADSLYLIEEGLIKLTRLNDTGSRIILSIHGPDHLVGEEVFLEETPTYYGEAEVLTTSSLVRIPREALRHALETNLALISPVLNYILRQKQELARKVELLCLHDVEYRILHYLAELSKLVKPAEDDESYQLPITQLELADLVGATRETTSTTLNQLERRGLVKLSRRLLTIPSPATLREATVDKKLAVANGTAVS
jgi:CRP-like cAMP-binding protein